MAMESDNNDGQKMGFWKERLLTDEEREERELAKRKPGVMRKSKAYTPVQTGSKVTNKEEVSGKEKVEGQEAVDKPNDRRVGGGGQHIQIDLTATRIDPKTGERTKETEYDVGRPMSETEFDFRAGETEAQWKKRQEMKKAAEEMRRRQLEQPMDVFELARMARE